MKKHAAMRAALCTASALLIVLNAPGRTAVGAAGVEPYVHPAADALAIQEPQLAVPAADRRLVARRPPLDPDADILRLINAEHPQGSEPIETVRVEGVSVAAEIAGPLQRLLAAAREKGLSITLASGYLSRSAQEHLYRRATEHYGWPAVESRVGRPGENEHGSGLAVDLLEDVFAEKTEGLADSELYEWLSLHCADYGFVLRYGEGKRAETGFVFEPWHFRYVGEEAARFMAEHELCLEEFLALYA